MACTSGAVSAAAPLMAALFSALLMAARLASVTPVTPAVVNVAAVSAVAEALFDSAAPLMAFKALVWAELSGAEPLPPPPPPPPAAAPRAPKPKAPPASAPQAGINGVALPNDKVEAVPSTMLLIGAAAA